MVDVLDKEKKDKGKKVMLHKTANSYLKVLSFFIFIFYLFVLFSCAPTTKAPVVPNKLVAKEAEKQRELAFQEYFKQNLRLNNIFFNLLKANAELCGKKVTYRYGFSVLNKDSASVFKDFANAAIKVLKLNEYPTAVYVLKNSPAYLAGLREGDVILSINGYELTPNKDSIKFLTKYIKKNKDKNITLHVRRENKELNITIKPAKICDYNVNLVFNDQVNAFADGKNITVFLGLLRFLQTDEELALVLGHELAHNVMGHITKQKANTLAGAIIGAVLSSLSGVDVTNTFAQAGRLLFSQEFEIEADYVGCYYAARAGYDVSMAGNIWRRMAISHPQIIGMKGGTHPSSAKRFVLIEKTVQEIQDKKQRGLPLIPEFKNKQ